MIHSAWYMIHSCFYILHYMKMLLFLFFNGYRKGKLVWSEVRKGKLVWSILILSRTTRLNISSYIRTQFANRNQSERMKYCFLLFFTYFIKKLWESVNHNAFWRNYISENFIKPIEILMNLNERNTLKIPLVKTL